MSCTIMACTVSVIWIEGEPHDKFRKEIQRMMDRVMCKSFKQPGMYVNLTLDFTWSVRSLFCRQGTVCRRSLQIDDKAPKSEVSSQLVQ